MGYINGKVYDKLKLYSVYDRADAQKKQSIKVTLRKRQLYELFKGLYGITAW